MEQWLILVVMFFVGFLVSFQGAVNTALARLLGHPLHASVVSFATGLMALVAIVSVTGVGFPKLSELSKVPKITLVGGTLGVIFITCVICFVPKVGTARVAVASICGQIVFALLIDHFGVLGVPLHPVDIKRILGAAMVITGVVLINWR